MLSISEIIRSAKLLSFRYTNPNSYNEKHKILNFAVFTFKPMFQLLSIYWNILIARSITTNIVANSKHPNRTLTMDPCELWGSRLQQVQAPDAHVYTIINSLSKTVRPLNTTIP